MDDITVSQVLGGEGQTELSKTLPKSYATYRTIRKDPTVALARALSMAPVIAAEWGVESAKDINPDWVDLIDQIYMPMREPLLDSAMSGGIDFGWQGFEQVFDLRDGQTHLVKLKPLLQDMTDILVDAANGAFAGYKQEQVTVPVENCLHVPFRYEGTDWTGNSLLENVRGSYNSWVKVSDGARRYDEKVAGSHWIIYYPYGSSVFDGVLTENKVIARGILNTLESSGGVTIPRSVVEQIEEMHKEELGWKIELLGDGVPKQYSFTARLEYLDKLKVRGLLMPERAILEGKFGTKAEAGQHADLALTQMELTHRHITRFVNWHSVNRILVQNFGEEAENKVWLTTAPLSEDKLAFVREVYIEFLKSKVTVPTEHIALDIETVRKTLGLPTSGVAVMEPDFDTGVEDE